MSVTLDFSPDVEARLHDRAARKGLDLRQLLMDVAETMAAEPLPEKAWTAGELLKLPRAARTPILVAMARDAAPLYRADLALPLHERELTALEILNELDPVVDEFENDAN